jgi:hypothetical protein
MSRIALVSVRGLFVVLMLLAFAVTAGAQSFTATECALQGGSCDASNTCVKFQPQQDGGLVEVALGNCNTPPIIIFGPGDPPPPPPLPPFVAFINTTRSGDRVVAGKDSVRPGGTKELTVMIKPMGKTAQLTIKRTTGNAGSAFFDAARTLKTITVTDGQKITIFGGDVSDKARNLAITATINGNAVPGTFDFTSFRIDAQAFISGTLESVLPQRVKANSGKKVTSNQAGGNRKQTMRAYFQDEVTVNANGSITLGGDGKRDERGTRGVADFDRVGHKHINDVVAYGGIVFKGTIMPKGIPQTDFSRKAKNPGSTPVYESFNWTRFRTIREQIFDRNNVLLKTAQPCVTNVLDDSTDDDEDLFADDGAVWAIDVPAVFSQTGTGRPDLRAGDVARGTELFKEHVEYGGVRVSGFIDWHWLYSHARPATGSAVFVQENTFAAGVRDNKMGLTTVQVPTNCTAPR